MVQSLKTFIKVFVSPHLDGHTFGWSHIQMIQRFKIFIKVFVSLTRPIQIAYTRGYSHLQKMPFRRFVFRFFVPLLRRREGSSLSLKLNTESSRLVSREATSLFVSSFRSGFLFDKAWAVSLISRSTLSCRVAGNATLLAVRAANSKQKAPSLQLILLLELVENSQGRSQW